MYTDIFPNNVARFFHSRYDDDVVLKITQIRIIESLVLFFFCSNQIPVSLYGGKNSDNVLCEGEKKPLNFSEKASLVPSKPIYK